MSKKANFMALLKSTIDATEEGHDATHLLPVEGLTPREADEVLQETLNAMSALSMAAYNTMTEFVLATSSDDQEARVACEAATRLIELTAGMDGAEGRQARALAQELAEYVGIQEPPEEPRDFEALLSQLAEVRA